MLRILKAKLVSNFTDRHATFFEQLFRTFDNSILDMSLGSSTCFLTDKVTKVVGRLAGFAGKIRHRWQTLTNQDETVCHVMAA